MGQLQTDLETKTVTKLLHFPHSFDFRNFFKGFEEVNIWNMSDTKINEVIYDFIGELHSEIDKKIKELRISLLTEVDWRFEPERTADGFRLETLQPVIKISGNSDDLAKLFLPTIQEFGNILKFSTPYENALIERNKKDEHPRNALRDWWYISHGLPPISEPTMAVLLVRGEKKRTFH